MAIQNLLQVIITDFKMTSKFPILLIFVNVIKCNVYFITPDAGYCNNNISYHYCGSLQNFLLSTSSNFVANTQLTFLPGLHHLSANLSIQHVYNITLVGSVANGTTATIQCSTEQLLITMTNITQLTIKDVVIADCGVNVSSYNLEYHKYSLYTVQLYHCSDVTMQNITILSRNIYDSLMSVNTLGSLKFYNISSAGMTLVYNNHVISGKKTFGSTFSVLIDNFQCNYFIYPPNNKIIITLHQSRYDVHVNIMNTNFCFKYNIFTVDILMIERSHDIIEIIQCSCNKLIVYYHVTLFKTKDDPNAVSHSRGNSIVQIKNCNFTDMICAIGLGCTLFQTSSLYTTIDIIDCNFVDLNNIVILDSGDCYNKKNILIRNTLFMSIFSWQPLARLTNKQLLFEGLVLFKGVNVTENVPLFDVFNVGIYIYNYVEISNCYAKIIVPNDAVYFALTQPATVNFTSNTVASFTDTKFEEEQSPCTFQFFNNYNLDFEFKANTKLNFSIVFNANQWVNPLNNSNLKINHCVWLPGSAFNATCPSDVNHRMITLINESFVTVNKSLCYCYNQEQIDCQVDELGPIYPGQTLNIMLAYPNAYRLTPLFVDVYDIEMPPTACKVSFLQDANQIVGQTCTQLNFTIIQINDYYKWCELNFKLPFSADDG